MTAEMKVLLKKKPFVSLKNSSKVKKLPSADCTNESTKVPVKNMN